MRRASDRARATGVGRTSVGSIVRVIGSPLRSGSSVRLLLVGSLVVVGALVSHGSLLGSLGINGASPQVRLAPRRKVLFPAPARSLCLALSSSKARSWSSVLSQPKAKR